MSDLKTLIEAHASHAAHTTALAAKIAEKRLEAKAESIAIVKALMGEVGLVLADLGGTVAVKNQAKTGRAAVAPKYRNEATGETWSGRGMRPRWMKAAIDAGQDVESFRIKPALAAVPLAA